MNNKEFEIILSKRIKCIKLTLVKKGVEYSRNEDRLYNFRRAAQITGESPEQALWGYGTQTSCISNRYNRKN